jgi:hypothetical protein
MQSEYTFYYLNGNFSPSMVVRKRDIANVETVVVESEKLAAKNNLAFVENKTHTTDQPLNNLSLKIYETVNTCILYFQLLDFRVVSHIHPRYLDYSQSSQFSAMVQSDTCTSHRIHCYL